MSAGTISPGLAISSARCLRGPVAVGTPAQRHFAVYHFVVHEIFGGEPLCSRSFKRSQISWASSEEKQ